MWRSSPSARAGVGETVVFLKQGRKAGYIQTKLWHWRRNLYAFLLRGGSGVRLPSDKSVNLFIIRRNLTRPGLHLEIAGLWKIGSMPGNGVPLVLSPRGFGQFLECDSMEAIVEGVRQIISSELNIPLERLTPDTALEDVGVTSLDLVFIIFALEEKFSISIPYNANEAAAAGERGSAKSELGQFKSIAQISAAVKALMDAKAS